MNIVARALIFTAVLLGGCRATRDVAVKSYHMTRGVAVGSYRVATAPVHYALKGRRDDSSTTATTTETRSSDVTTPGEPVPAPKMAMAQQQSQSVSPRIQNPSVTTAPRVNHKETSQAKTRPSPSTHAVSAQLEFPTAKLVPGKPGYVLSPFDTSGRYVDVSGYTSGSKVKDPWTDKIFIVP
jgi:hypothetical protein